MFDWLSQLGGGEQEPLKLKTEEVALTLGWFKQEGKDKSYEIWAEGFSHPNGWLPDHDFDRQIEQREMNPIVNKMIEQSDKLEYTDVY